MPCAIPRTIRRLLMWACAALLVLQSVVWAAVSPFGGNGMALSQRTVATTAMPHCHGQMTTSGMSGEASPDSPAPDASCAQACCSTACLSCTSCALMGAAGLAALPHGLGGVGVPSATAVLRGNVQALRPSFIADGPERPPRIHLVG